MRKLFLGGLLALAGCGPGGGEIQQADGPVTGKVTFEYEYEHFGTFPAWEVCPSLRECSCLPTPNVPIPYPVSDSDWSVETPYAVTLTADVQANVGATTVAWRNTTTGNSYSGPSVTIPTTELHGSWDYVFSHPLAGEIIPACSYAPFPGHGPESIFFPLDDYADPQFGLFVDSVIVWLTYDDSQVSQVFPLCHSLSDCDTQALSYDSGPDFTCKLVAVPRSPNPPVEVKWEKAGGPTLYGNEVVRGSCNALFGKWTVTLTDALGNSVTAQSAFDGLRDEGVSFQIPD